MLFTTDYDSPTYTARFEGGEIQVGQRVLHCSLWWGRLGDGRTPYREERRAVLEVTRLLGTQMLAFADGTLGYRRNCYVWPDGDDATDFEIAAQAAVRDPHHGRVRM